MGWIIGFSSCLYAQSARKPTAGDGVKAWHVNEDYATETSTTPDTLSNGFQITSTPAYIRTIASEWLGNMGLPSQSAIFADRHQTDIAGDFLFRHPYYDNYLATDRVYFFNTLKPYSNLSYATGGFAHHGEDHLTARFSINANKRLNFGLFADYVYGRGAFYKQSSDDLNGYLNGSYRDEKYSIYFIAGLNNFRNFENGGITDDKLLNSIDDPQNLPVKLSNAWSIYNSFYFWVNQQYNIGYYQTDPNDSEVKTFVPAMTVGYSIKYENSQKKYYEKSITQGFYEHNYYSDVASNDTAANHFLKNVISFTMNEGFQKWAIFGVRAFAEIDMDCNMRMIADSTYTYDTQALIAVGGELFKRKGITTYGVNGKVFLLGRDKRLSFDVTGDFNSSWRISPKDSTLRMSLHANGHVKSITPSYFTEHYYSNHFIWDQLLDNIWSARAYGSISIPYKYCDFSIGAGWQGLKNYVYFDHNALVAQDTKNFIQIISADVKFNLTAWKFHWDNQVSVQYSSHPEILPLPLVSAYSNLYFKTTIFKYLTVQLGVDCRYNTAYYANAYMPATGQFHLQNTTLVGNYPLMNAYINLHLKQFRFFAMYYNFSQGFLPANYFTVPHYPLNPGMFKCGLSWNFYD